MKKFPVSKTDDEWRKLLTPDQYHVCREKGTEAPFCGAYTDNKEGGVYHCVCCDHRLFTSENKFDSGSGWPSYWQPFAADSLLSESDSSHGMRRTEVLCSQCGAHLGHVFNDGPPPTGLRYCINSVALVFRKK